MNRATSKMTNLSLAKRLAIDRHLTVDLSLRLRSFLDLVRQNRPLLKKAPHGEIG